jgi:hypothetical protein
VARASRPSSCLAFLLLTPPALAQLAFTESAAILGCVHTFSPAPGYPGTHDQMVGGLCVADFNHDSWPDIYALGGGNQPDRLFLNTGGAFAEADPSESPGGWNLPAPHRGAALAAGDVNRDGLTDLFIVSYGPISGPASNAACMLLLNRGGRFEQAPATAGVNRVSNSIDGTSPTLGDIDNDGDLDLFVTAWAMNAGGNRLFINRGNNPDGVPVFDDASASLGVDLSTVRGYTARMIDLNNDRLPELLINGDFRTSRLLINLGPAPDGLPRFADAASRAGITADANAMGMAIADADNDGDLDWFTTNIYSQFTGNANTLYLNQGLDAQTDPDAVTPIFSNAAQTAGVANAGWGWGALFADLDHDADLDLVATGGWHQYPPTPARLWRNNAVLAGIPRYTEVAAQSGLSFTGLGRTLASLDFDRDGDLDLAMSARGTPLRLFRNNSVSGNHWITLTLNTSPHPCLPADGRHTRVEITSRHPDASTRTQVRVLDGGPTYLGHSQLIAHAGLLDATTVDAVLHLPDGSTRALRALAVDTHHLVRIHHPADFSEDGLVDLADLAGFASAFAANSPDADQNADGLNDLGDVVRFIYALLGNPCEAPD